MSSSPRVAVIRTGIANLASVLAGLRRAGGDPFVTENPRDVEESSHVMLPGVGSFAAGMESLNGSGITPVLRARIADDRPTLCICLGLQLLCAASEEGPGVEGLGAVPATVRRFPDGVRRPQFGWNEVVPAGGARCLARGHAYFANSYFLPAAPEGWSAAFTTHGVSFVSSLERGNVVACQFHPELSGAFGAGVLRRWIALEDCGC